MIVDSHQHFWDLERVYYPWLVPEYGPIFRTFEPAELEPELAAAGVDRTVLVQAACNFEDTEALLAQAAAHDWIGAVVGWVPLYAHKLAEDALDRYMADRWFKGVRHLNHDEPDPNWLVRPDVMAGLRLLEERGLTFDVVAVYPLHLHHVPTLAEAFPGLTIVIDHLAKPPIASGEYDGWKAELRAAAAHSNVHAKISGLNTAADPDTWTATDLVEPIGFSVEVFGARRLMFGSDWPVANLAGDYAKVWSATNAALDELGIGGAEREAILGGTAARVYGIEAP